MADLPQRGKLEAKLAKDLSRVMQTMLGQIMDALGNPPNVANVGAGVWQDITQGLAQVLRPHLEATALQAAENGQASIPDSIGADLDSVIASASEWASQHTFDLVSDLNDTTRRLLQQEVSAFIASGETNLAILAASLQAVFGPSRAENIAVTETSRAIAQGEKMWADALRDIGIDLTPVWQTVRDERVCPICGPRDQAKRGDGWEEYPPAHPRCRCWVNHVFPESIRARILEGATWLSSSK